MEAITLEKFIDDNPQKKIKADILERWQTRILPRDLHTQGEAGAQLYLRDYGKSIAAPKCLQFGALALQNGCPEFAAGFYKKAAELMGVEIYPEVVSDAGNPNHDLSRCIVSADPGKGRSVQVTQIVDFPLDMQPGKFVPMQPVDGKKERGAYIDDPHYWMQPKIDGSKLIVFVTRDNVWYQSRSLRLTSTPDLDFERELKAAANFFGSFILEGELTFLDWEMKEHRTGAQAATANAELGHPQWHPVMQFVVFSAPWCENLSSVNYGDMVLNGNQIAIFIRETIGQGITVPIKTAMTAGLKADLALAFSNSGREGEVWFRYDMPYRPGKHKDESFVRTKYLTEFDALVVGFTDTTAEGHAFGAMLIHSLDDKPLGAVGTGFTREQKRELMQRYHASLHGGNMLRVAVRSQGYTEDGKAWHARFLEIVE